MTLPAKTATLMNGDSNISETCHGCGSARLHSFFRTATSPVNCGSVPASRAEAENATVGEIELIYCSDCQLVFNRAFIPNLVAFQPGYEVALTHSKVFADFQTGVIQRLTNKHDLYGKRILEIGCGDGVFLKKICQHGGNHGVGIDPSVAEVGLTKLESGSVTFVRDYFRHHYADEIHDFICCLSAFENIPEPKKFLLMLRKMIGDRNPGIYFEVFNGFRAIDSGEIWSIHYEQCNYFSLATLEKLFRETGFIITDSGCCFQGDQYLYIDVIPSPEYCGSTDPIIEPTASLPSLPALVQEFSDRHQMRLSYWKARLAQTKLKNKSVVLWGSAGKGISFLNAIADSQAIDAVVDINPKRQNRFIPGTGHPIVAPEWLVQHPPDLIVLTNPIYKSEIRELVSKLSIVCEFDII